MVYTFTANETVTWDFDDSANYGSGGRDLSKFSIKYLIYVKETVHFNTEDESYERGIDDIAIGYAFTNL